MTSPTPAVPATPGVAQPALSSRLSRSRSSAFSQWPGLPRRRELIRDALAGARSQVIITLTLAAVLATVCLSVLVTTGQAAASESRIVEQIDSAGTRLIAISDDAGNAAILSDAPAAVEAMSDVSWAFGLGPAFEVSNPWLPVGRTAARLLVGALPPDALLVQGRAPQPGEAIVGVQAAESLHIAPALGVVEPFGTYEPAVGVVGIFQADGPLSHLNNIVLIASDPADVEELRFVYVMASDVTTVARLEDVLATSTPARNHAALFVETPTGAIALREVIAGQVGAASRQLMAMVMGVGAVIIAITMLSATAARRREFGRRRALGATRSLLVASVLIQASLSALLGIVVGIAGGLVMLDVTTQSLPSWHFTAGVAGLSLLVTLLAAAPIALMAARRDPLRILRVP